MQRPGIGGAAEGEGARGDCNDAGDRLQDGLDVAVEECLTDGDLRRSLQKHGVAALQMPMSELMTRTPRTIRQELLAWEAMKSMEANQQSAITSMPVIDDQQRLLGLIKMHDIIQSGLS